MAFSLYFVPLAALGEQLKAAGFGDYQRSMHRGAFAYLPAGRAGQRRFAG
jgi:hypothetical protein